MTTEKYLETSSETVSCPICGKKLKNTKKSVGAHIGYWHKEEAQELYNKETEFSMECLECNKKVANSKNVLARHARKEHNLEWVDYVVKHEYGGEHPTCKCGCGERVAFAKGGFRKFIKGHDSRGKNNSMYGKKGKDNPNTGKKRTDEMKERYRQAALDRDDTDRISIMKTDEYRDKMSKSQIEVFKSTNKAENISEGMKTWWENNPEQREINRERVIQLQAEGRMGPQGPYKTEWKYNPFTDQDEYMHSSWESRFLDHMIAHDTPVTKVHDIRILWTNREGKKKVYIPDFRELENDVLYEIKGGQDEDAELKAEAAERWSDKNGFEYNMLWKKEMKEI